jgi:hypothetical protein
MTPRGGGGGHNEVTTPHQSTTTAAAAAAGSASATPGRGHNYGRFDASALHIAHALKATQLQKAYKKEKPIHHYLVRIFRNLIWKG